MRFYPDCDRAYVLREGNPCHQPAGKPEGGQFAPKGKGECGSFYSATKDKDKGEPRGKKPIPAHADVPVDVEGGGGDIGGLSAEDFAAGMFAHARTPVSDVTVKGRDSDDDSDVDPEFDEEAAQRDYEAARDEARRDFTTAAYDEDLGRFRDNADSTYDHILKPAYEEAVKQAAEELLSSGAMLPFEEEVTGKFHQSDVQRVADEILNREEVPVAKDNPIALGAHAMMVDGVKTLLEQDSNLDIWDSEKAKDELVEYFKERILAGEGGQFPSQSAAGRTAEDESPVYDSEDHWAKANEDLIDEHMKETVGDFGEWLERTGTDEYYHYPETSGEAGVFEITASVGSGGSITRTVKTDEHGLHVHHNYFRVGTDSGQSMGKDILYGHFKTYEAAGVDYVTTSANIYVGSYAWARYGFLPDNPEDFASDARSRSEDLRRMNILTEAQHGLVREITQRNSDPKIAWDIADLRMSETPERAKELNDKLYDFMVAKMRSRDSNPPSAPSLRRLLDKDTADGVVNVGRALLFDNQWGAHIDMKNADQIARLKEYIGDFSAKD